MFLFFFFSFCYVCVCYHRKILWRHLQCHRVATFLDHEMNILSTRIEPFGFNFHDVRAVNKLNSR